MAKQKNNSKILIGLAVVGAAIYIGQSGNKEISIQEMKKTLSNDVNLSEGEKNKLRNNIFPVATEEELKFIYNIIYRKITAESNIGLYKQIQEKYKIFT